MNAAGKSELYKCLCNATAVEVDEDISGIEVVEANTNSSNPEAHVVPF